MKCKDCGYWGGSDSKGDTRKCYHVDIYSNTPPDFKHKDDTCEWKKDEEVGMNKPDLGKPVFSLFPEAKKDVVANQCPFCKTKIDVKDFRDELSRKEYGISGLCQGCQDKTFVKGV